MLAVPHAESTLVARGVEAPAAIKSRLVGVGNGIAVEATRAPVPHFSKNFRKFGI